MNVGVNLESLSDSPYQKGREGVCVFDEIEVHRFACELIFGSQTCYLVSGYRGVGKTSFINKVKESVETSTIQLIPKGKSKVEPHKGKPETYLPVFVYASFAKYDGRTAFLRQMIRNLFLAFEEREVHEKSLLDFLTDEFKRDFSLLNARTFFDVRAQYHDESIATWTSNFSTKLGEIKSALGKIAIPVPIMMLVDKLSSIYNWSNLTSIVAWIAGTVVSLFGFIELTFNKTSIRKASMITSELYDDDIASHHFDKTLKKLYEQGFKIVFILDELDKVDDSEITSLINEMKPHLLSGLADFVVVAGQQLTYKYESVTSHEDDEVLSSLFSKVFHVPLKRTTELHELVKEKIFDIRELDQFQLLCLDDFIHRHVFQSGRIPRVLINRIRQDIRWDKDRPFILVPDVGRNERYQKLIFEIDAVIKDTIFPLGHKDVVNDYLIMQLYSAARRLDLVAGRSLDNQYLLQKYKTSMASHPYHHLYFEELAPCLNKLMIRLQPLLGYTIAGGDTAKKASQFNSDGETDDIVSIAFNTSLQSFKQEINDCVWVLRMTLKALGDKDSEKILTLDAYELLVRLQKRGILQRELPTDSLFMRFLKKPSILETDINLEEAYKISQAEQFDFNKVSYDVLFSYLLEVVTAVFDEYIVQPSSEKIDNDVLVMSKIEEFSDLLVDFKFIKIGLGNVKATDLAEKLIKYNSKSSKGNYAALIIFSFEGKESFEAEKFRLMSELRNMSQSKGELLSVEEKFSITIVSVEEIIKIFDDILLLKNRMVRYMIDSKGFPSREIFANTTGRTYHFKNQIQLQSDPSRNDHTLPEVFQLPPLLVIKVKPDETPFWRFGLKFSPDGNFPKFEEGRHVEPFADIHICVGEPAFLHGKPQKPDEPYQWLYPKVLKVTNYFIDPEEESWQFNEYNGGEVTMEFQSLGDRTFLSVLIDGNRINGFTFNDPRLKFFKVSAWADTINFNLNAQILFPWEKNVNEIKNDMLGMSSPAHRFNSSITGNILQAPEGVFSVWGFVSDIHNKIFENESNFYLVGYASNRGEDLQNPSLARYPNAWGISRVVPTHSHQLGSWRFMCNSTAKELTKLELLNFLPNGWHMFSIAWSRELNYIKFIIDDKIVDEGPFENWPTDFSHSIRVGTWPSGAPEFSFHSEVGRWRFIALPYDENIISERLKDAPLK